MARRVDLLLVNGYGTVYLLRAASRRGQWILKRVSDDRQEWDGAVVVEHRFVSDIIRGALADGLRVL